MKLKSKVNKEVYEDEFKDLDTKKEVTYANYLHEQTRKIFLHDLADLKKKFKGSQNTSMNTMHQSGFLTTLPNVMSKRTATAHGLLSANGGEDQRLNSAGSLRLRPSHAGSKLSHDLEATAGSLEGLFLQGGTLKGGSGSALNGLHDTDEFKIDEKQVAHAFYLTEPPV